MAKEIRDIRERAFEFAVRIVKLCQHLDKKPGVPRPESKVADLRDEADEIKRILGSIVVSARKRL